MYFFYIIEKTYQNLPLDKTHTKKQKLSKEPILVGNVLRYLKFLIYKNF